MQRGQVPSFLRKINLDKKCFCAIFDQKWLLQPHPWLLRTQMGWWVESVKMWPKQNGRSESLVFKVCFNQISMSKDQLRKYRGTISKSTRSVCFGGGMQVPFLQWSSRHHGSRWTHFKWEAGRLEVWSNISQFELSVVLRSKTWWTKHLEAAESRSEYSVKGKQH